MIGEYLLEILCDKYKVSKEKIVNKNNNILSYGEFSEIDKTLNYLINTLKVNPRNIEKCPSILYRNTDEIQKNIVFLKEKTILFSNIETCLSVLSTDSKQLEETYDYVLKNYGIAAINKNTTILSCPIDIIIDIEKLELKKEYNLAISSSISFGYTSLENVIKIIKSDEFKAHPELFTSQTLAHAKLEDIQKIIKSDEFKAHPELFTSTTLAKAKLEDIQELLNLSCFQNEKYKRMLTSSIVSKSKSMIKKMPILIEMAEYYKIDDHINTQFLLYSPSQNYALINYLIENDNPLVINEKLNPIFSYQPGVLRKKYGIDIKVLMDKYPIPEKNMGGKVR